MSARPCSPWCSCAKAVGYCSKQQTYCTDFSWSSCLSYGGLFNGLCGPVLFSPPRRDSLCHVRVRGSRHRSAWRCSQHFHNMFPQHGPKLASFPIHSPGVHHKKSDTLIPTYSKSTVITALLAGVRRVQLPSVLILGPFHQVFSTSSISNPSHTLPQPFTPSRSSFLISSAFYFRRPHHTTNTSWTAPSKPRQISPERMKIPIDRCSRVS